MTIDWPIPYGKALDMQNDSVKFPETKAEFRTMMESASGHILNELRVGTYAPPNAGSLSYSNETAQKIANVFEATLAASSHLADRKVVPTRG